MRLPFVVLCLAFAVSPMGVGAEPSDILTKSGSIKRHLQVDQPVPNNAEERTDFENLHLLADVADKYGLEDLNALLKSHVAAEASDMTPVELQSSTKSFVSELETQDNLKRLQRWLDDVADDPINLELGENTDIAQTKTILKLYEMVVNLFNLVNTKSPTRLIKVLQDVYGDEGVKKIITIAKTNEATAPTAILLELERVILRMRSDFTLLDLREMSEWLDAVDVFNKMYPNEAKTVLERLKYSDNNLVNMLFRSKASPRSSLVKTRVLDELVTKWLEKKKIPKDVFVLFGLHHNKNLNFASSRFQEWMHYANEFYTTNLHHEDESYISTLVSMYLKKKLLDTLMKTKMLAKAKRVALDLEEYLKKTEDDGKAESSDIATPLRAFINSIPDDAESDATFFGTS